MPRLPQHALIWSPVDKRYALHVPGHAARHFEPGDEESWQGWLATASSFAFRGASGSLNVYREARPRGGSYWYAYRTAGGRTRKRYLGATARVSLARLEDIAASLGVTAGSSPPAVVPRASEDGALAALPATKFAPPQPPAAPVGRGRLLAALDAALATPLTLVSAPAGWGKTTALAAWAGRHPRRVAWLALEAADDEPVRFWAAVITALRTRAPGVGAPALAMLRAPQPAPLTAAITALLNELDGGHGGDPPLILLLDDYQVIASAAIREGVAFLLDHLPAGLRLVVAGRADPDLPLARLRARGRLAELRAADLRFTEEETGAFLGGALDAPLPDDAVRALARRTEGWAAGLQLAALALRAQADRPAWLARFTGGHRFLLDYVEEEILARQPPAIRRFLLQVAVLPWLGADLCAAVTGEAASGALLADLERQNLFLAPLDEERRWYRLHDLFREALLARARADDPALLPGAHRRAAAWHAARGDGREAVAHALAGEDYPLATTLIEREAPRLWLGGEAGAVLGWLLVLPDAILWHHARLALDAALRLVGALHATADAPAAEPLARVERLLARVEAGLRAPGDPASPAAEVALLRRRLRLLRALLEARALLPRGDAARLERLADELAGAAEGEEARWRLIWLALRFWLEYSFRRQGSALLPPFLAFKRQALEEGDHQAALTALLSLAHLYAAAGQLHQAEQECLEGLALAERLGMQTASTGYLQLQLGFAYYAWDRRGEAAEAARALLRIARAWAQIDLLIWGNLLLARLALAGGDPVAADRALREAEETVRRERLTAFAPDVAAARAQYWLVTGDLTRAAQSVARVGFDPQTLIPTEHNAVLAQVRVALARRRYPEALATLDRFGQRLDRPGDFPTTVAYLALRLVALHGAGRRVEARAVAARLLALTAPADRSRAYLDEGAPMERALAALLATPGDETPDDPALPRAYIARLLAAFEEGRRAVSGRVPPEPGVPQGAPPRGPPLPHNRHRSSRSPGASGRCCGSSPTAPRPGRSPTPSRSPRSPSSGTSAASSASWARTAGRGRSRVPARPPSSERVPPNTRPAAPRIGPAIGPAGPCARRRAILSYPQGRTFRSCRSRVGWVMECRIRVRGHLDPSWGDRLAGLRIAHEDDGASLLAGPLPDQAALHGLLLQLIRLGLPLLALETADAPGRREPGGERAGEATRPQPPAMAAHRRQEETRDEG